MAPLPSDGELEILRVLWRVGPATVKGVHEQLPRRTEIGYNTVGKLLGIMERKGFVVRDETSRAHVFRHLIDREETQRSFVRDLADRAFGGSPAVLALRALGEEAPTSAELAELRAILADLED